MKEKELILQRIILENPEIREELEKAESVADVRNAFAHYGLELTEEGTVALMSSVLEPADGELSEGDLDGVAGGITLAQAQSAFLWGARVGIFGVMVYDYYKYGDAQKTYSKKQLSSGKFWKK